MRAMRAMSYRMLMLAALLGGCATAGSSSPDNGVDASTKTDGRPQAQPDAPTVQPQIDAPSGGCTPTVTELMINGSFDGSPIGTGWTAAPINATYPIVTAQDGVAEQSPVNKAWMGGLAQANANDSLYQDIAVPAGATQIVLTGFYDVRTAELGSTVYDSGKVELVQTSGALIESVKTLDNAHATTTWTALNHPVTAAVAGQTVRLRFSTASDTTYTTSFYFDSLSLKATVCQ